MKTSHTGAFLEKDDPVNKSGSTQTILIEDMSLCEDDNKGDQGTEELLVEKKSCDKCDFLAADESMLEKHLEETHGDSTSSNLNEEVAPPTVKPLPLYKCNKCSFATTTTANLKEHKETMHDTAKEKNNETVFLHSCISCEYETNDYSELLEHSGSYHKEESYENVIVCEICSKNFKSKEECMSHITDHSSQINCEMCGKINKSALELEWHLETEHAKVECFKCLVCTVTCTSQDNLDIHMVQAHGNPCSKCKDVFATGASLSLHMVETHMSEELPTVLDPGQRASLSV